MARHMIIVSREHGQFYDYLIERFRDDDKVDVILDRRSGIDRRASGHRGTGTHALGGGPDRRRADRRQRPELDIELRERSHVVISPPM